MFGLYTGFVLGYMVEDTYINFEASFSKRRKNIFAKNTAKYDGVGKKVLRFIIGLVSLLAIYLIFKYLESMINVFEYIKYTIVVFWGVAGAPALFKLFKLA